MPTPIIVSLVYKNVYEFISRKENLKVPKHEIFLTELIILSYPIWTGDLGSTAKN